MVPKEVIDNVAAVKEVAEDKISTSFGRSYFFAWFVFNYKPFIVIFSMAEYDEKLKWLSENISGDFFGYAEMFGAPFVFALLYVLLSPSAQILVSAGNRLADYGLRQLQAKLDRNYWYSSVEYNKVSLECDAKLKDSAERLANIKGELLAERRAADDVKTKYDSLLAQIMRYRYGSGIGAGAVEGGYKIDADTAMRIAEAASLQLKKPCEPITVVPHLVAQCFVDALSVVDEPLCMSWIDSDGMRGQQYALAFLQNTGLAEICTNKNLYQYVKPTPAGRILMNYISRVYPDSHAGQRWSVALLD